MQWQFNTIVLVNGVNTLICLFVMTLLWNRRSLPGARRAFVMMSAIAWWVAFATLETASVGLAAKLVFASVEYLGICATPLAYLWLSMEFGGSRSPLTPRSLRWLAVMPVLLVLLVFSNPWHQLIWTRFHPAPSGQLHYEHGPGYLLVLAYNYALFLFASVRMLHAIFNFPRHYWRLGVLLTAALATPFAASLVYSMGWAPPGIDPTPLGLSFTGFAIAMALLHTKLFDIAPIAREILVDRMHEGIMVFDSLRRLVDFNPAAQKLTQGSLRIGLSADHLPEPWNVLASRLEDSTTEPVELGPFPDDGWIEARIGPLNGVSSRSAGHLVILYDIARRKAMERQLLELASHDPLTGLSNRHVFAETMRRELARCQRGGVSLAVILMDVDHFKNLNDTYGHSGGDLVLQRLAEVLRASIRPEDCACRWGGEEFVVALSGCTLDVALAKADQWRTAFEQLRIETPEGTIRTSMSLGVALAPLHGQDEATLLRAADAALYRSKGEGRNRVSLASGPAAPSTEPHPSA